MNNYEDIKKLQVKAVKNIKEFDAVAKGQSKGFDRLEKRVEKLYNNSFLISLDLDGVKRWEKIFRITPLGTLEMRRNAIIAHRRGSGKLSGTIIKNMAIAYQNGEVEVWFDKDKTALMIKFISQYGIPNGLEKLKKIIEELKPARLPIEYLFNYLLIRDIHNVMTISDMQQIPLNKFAGGVR